MRPDSAWLAAGLGCAALAAQLRWAEGSMAGVVEPIAVALRDPGVDLADAAAAVGASLDGAFAVLVRLAVLVVGAGLLAAALLGRLGPVRPGAVRDLGGIGPVPARLRVAIAGTVVLVGFVAVDLQRRVAGGARAADASADALTQLWRGGASGTLFAVAVAMIVAGAIEALQMRRDQRAATIPTPEQAADEARRSGGARA